MCLNKLYAKQEQLKNEMNELMNNKQMRDMCFTSCGCGNRATLKKIQSYRDKIGVIGNKQKVIDLAIKIAKEESFTHDDILEIYTYFLQVRNPDLYYDICMPVSKIKNLSLVVSTVINLFLPICKNEILNKGIKYDNLNGFVLDIKLDKQIA